MKRVGLMAFAAAAALCAGGIYAAPAYAVANTCTWTGTAGDNKFSTATNWSGCNSTAPQAGDVIEFVYTTNASVTISNDLPAGTKLGGLTVDTEKAGTTTGETTQFQINSLAFGDAAVIAWKSGPGITISGNVTTEGSLTLDSASASIFWPTTQNIVLKPTDLSISNVPAPCRGGGTQYSTSIEPTGQVNVGAATWYTMAGTEAGITVASTSGIFLPAGNYAGNITFNGGGVANQARDCSNQPTYSMGAYENTTLSGTVTLVGGDVYYLIDTGKTLTVTGTLNGNGSALKPYASSTGTFVNNAKTNTSTTPTGTQTVEIKTLPAITDSKEAQDLYVEPNTNVQFDGLRRYVSVGAKAVLTGTGTAGQQLYVGRYGTVAPGHSPGCLTSDTLTLSGTYQFELGGVDACTGYDQLIVKNASSVIGAVQLSDTSAFLETSRYNGYTPKQGQEFVIINQAGDKAVDGNFKDLPEGATFSQNGITFKISYKGGDGNDVTLTVMNVPTAPNTGVQILKASPLVIVAGAFGVAIALMAVAKFAKQ